MAYVYLHRKETDNEVFYVGKGSHKNRAYRNDGRNQHWHRVVNKYGKTVEIFKDNLEENLAFYLEKFLILVYGKENLTNKTDGGEGASGCKWPKSSYEKRAATPHHMKNKELAKKVADVQRGVKRPYCQGSNHWTHKKPELVKRGIGNSRSRKVKCVQTSQIFDSFSQILEWLKSIEVEKASTGNLVRSCKSKHKNAYGYKWEYAE